MSENINRMSSYERHQAGQFARYAGARALGVHGPALEHNGYARMHDQLTGYRAGQTSRTVVGSSPFEHYRSDLARQIQQAEQAERVTQTPINNRPSAE